MYENFSAGTCVVRAMTPATQDDEIFFTIRSRLAPPNLVMDLQLISSATPLAFPAIPLENFHLQLAVTPWVEPNTTAFGDPRIHADRLISPKNCCCSKAGRNPKNRRNDIRSMSGFPFSRFAPARKSAQIISRQ